MRKYWYIIPIFAFALGIFVGCGSSSSSNGGGSANPQGMCSPGYIYSSQYGCMVECPGQPGYGKIPGTNQCVLANAGGGGYGYYVYGGSMNILNLYQYQLFLEGMGICNQWSAWNFGTAACSSWSTGSVQVGFSGSTGSPFGTVTVLAYLNGSWGMGGATTGFSGVFQPTNANTAYALQTYGPYGTPSYNSQIQVIVTAPNPSIPINLALDNQVTINLYYQGVQFASAVGTRGY